MHCESRVLFSGLAHEPFGVIHHAFSFSLQDTDINDALGDGGATRWKEPGHQDRESCPTDLNVLPELSGELEINFYDIKLLSLGHLFVTLA